MLGVKKSRLALQTNPYRPGTGRRPPFLAGRDGQLEEFETSLSNPERAQSFLITGLRGVGKTVLAREYETLGRGAGWAVVRQDLSMAFEDSRVFEEEMTADLADAASQLSMIENAKQIGGRFAPVPTEIKVTPPGGPEFAIDFRARARTGIPYGRKLRKDMHKLGELAKQHHRGVVLIYDEAQLARDDPKKQRTSLADLMAAVIAAQEDSLPVILVLAGLPSLVGFVREAKSNTERCMAVQEIGNLSPDDALHALTVPARAAGLPWKLTTAEEMVESCRAYPWFLQLAGEAAWDEARKQGLDVIDERAAGPALERVRARLDRDLYGPRLEEASPADRVVMAASASLAKDVFRLKDLQRRMAGDRTEDAVRVALGRLKVRGLVHDTRHGWAFSLPMYGEYLRRTTPYKLEMEMPVSLPVRGRIEPPLVGRGVAVADDAAVTIKVG